MPTIPGYHITEQLYESAHSQIYRARRVEDDRPVVLKILRGEFPTPEEVARFRREYAITSNLHLEGVIEVYRLVSYQNTLLMELEDFGGEALPRILPAHPLELAEFLRLAIRIADILGRVHQQQIIHKDINPANLIWNPDTNQLKIIDFGISTTLPREQPEARNPDVLEGTLAYLSPEQTGRMNRSVDYRTDFYSLGATLYDLLSGQPPFQADDALELVHCHLSKMPIPPSELPPHPDPLPKGEGDILPSPFRRGAGGEVLRILSAIILKLMAKNAEDRYQSAFGLKTDLEWCLAHLTDLQALSGFIPGQHDMPDRFHIPQKLYGRAQEISILLAAFDRLANPQSEISNLKSQMLLIAGYSGIGKTALVHEVHKPITAQRGYFIEGKFDQFQRNEPYSALIKAFQSLVRQLLTESDTQIAAWKAQLRNALGPNGQVIIAVIPEVALLIGSQPAVPELPPAQAQNRFNFVFQNFVCVFAAPEHPLALFLDDLQWADAPSLQLLKLLMTGSQTRYLLVIGAYRDNEVRAAHPLMLTLKDMQQAGAAISTITMGPLALDDVAQLIAETLKTPPRKAVLPLTEICHQKTSGNPFFLTQFLTSLHEEGHVKFNRQLLSWQYDVPAIQQAGVTANVVALMTSRIHKLPETTQQVLQLAACIGNQFDLSTLAVVHEHAHTETFQAVWPALQEGLLVPLDDAYKYIGLTDNVELQTPHPETPNTHFKFLHDRVQQAAYAFIANDRKQVVHLTIGRLLLANLPETEQAAWVFEIADHVNVGRALVIDSPEKEQFARLNLHAGQKAKASAAYEPAFQYLQNGLALLASTCWQQQYDLALVLHVEAAEAAYLSGNFEETERLAGTVIQHARTASDKALGKK